MESAFATSKSLSIWSGLSQPVTIYRCGASRRRARREHVFGRDAVNPVSYLFLVCFHMHPHAFDDFIKG